MKMYGCAMLFLLVLVISLPGQADGGTGNPTTPPSDKKKAPKKGYKEEKVQILFKTNNPFHGTLLLPNSAIPVPAVLMIPGYIPGANNRREEEFRGDHEEDTATTLARYFTGLGIAVLRIPIGGGDTGTEPALSLDDLSGRSLGCVDYLKGRPEINPERIGILGQSVGGFIAISTAARSRDLAFLMTLASPVEPIDRTFDNVLEDVLQSGGAPEADRAAIRNKMKSSFAAAAQGANAEVLRPGVEDFLRAEYRWLPKAQREVIGQDAGAFVQKLSDDHLRDMTSPMFRSLIGYDVPQALANVHCPMLILFAGRDFKVEPTRSSKIAITALQKTGRTNWVVEVIAEADHFFEGPHQNTKSANRTPEQRFPNLFLETLKTWLLKQTSAVDHP